LSNTSLLSGCNNACKASCGNLANAASEGAKIVRLSLPFKVSVSPAACNALLRVVKELFDSTNSNKFFESVLVVSAAGGFVVGVSVAGWVSGGVTGVGEVRLPRL